MYSSAWGMYTLESRLDHAYPYIYYQIVYTHVGAYVNKCPTLYYI